MRYGVFESNALHVEADQVYVWDSLDFLQSTALISQYSGCILSSMRSAVSRKCLLHCFTIKNHVSQIENLVSLHLCDFSAIEYTGSRPSHTTQVGTRASAIENRSTRPLAKASWDSLIGPVSASREIPSPRRCDTTHKSTTSSLCCS